jgi:hypothetical protein
MIVVVAGDVKDGSTDDSVGMVIGITEEQNGGMTGGFSSWDAKCA